MRHVRPPLSRKGKEKNKRTIYTLGINFEKDAVQREILSDRGKVGRYTYVYYAEIDKMYFVD